MDTSMEEEIRQLKAAVVERDVEHAAEREPEGNTMAVDDVLAELGLTKRALEKAERDRAEAER